MCKKSEVVNWEELIVSNMIQLEAITNLLDKSGIATKAEIMEEVRNVRAEIEKKAKEIQKEN